MRTVLGLVVVVVAFAWVLPSFASYSEVAQTLQSLDRRWLPAFAVASIVNLLAPAGLQWAALPGLRIRHAVIVDWVTSAVTNAVPGGSAVAVGLTWTMYRRLGLAKAAIARSIVVTGVWDQIFKLTAPLAAVIWLSTERPVGPGLIQASLVGGALFAVVVGLCTVLVAGPRAAVSVGGFLDRLAIGGRGWPDRLERLRQDTVLLVRLRWLRLTLWTVGGHLSLFVLLVICLRATGVPATALTAAAVFAALAFGRLITAIPLTPGGLGVMEVGLAGALTAVGTADEVSVVAAVLLFRFVSFALTIPLGAMAWLVWSGSSTAVDDREAATPTGRTADAPAR